MDESTAHRISPKPPGWDEHISSVFTAIHQGQEPPPHICITCGELQGKDGTPLMKCASCHRGRYCSKQCQKKRWKQHKRHCGLLKGIEGAERYEVQTQESGENENEGQPKVRFKEGLAVCKTLCEDVTPSSRKIDEYLEQATGIPALSHVGEALSRDGVFEGIMKDAQRDEE